MHNILLWFPFVAVVLFRARCRSDDSEGWVDWNLGTSNDLQYETSSIESGYIYLDEDVSSITIQVDSGQLQRHLKLTNVW